VIKNKKQFGAMITDQDLQFGLKVDGSGSSSDWNPDQVTVWIFFVLMKKRDLRNTKTGMNYQ
jgi:hypothetical protein